MQSMWNGYLLNNKNNNCNNTLDEWDKEWGARQTSFFCDSWYTIFSWDETFVLLLNTRKVPSIHSFSVAPSLASYNISNIISVGSTTEMPMWMKGKNQQLLCLPTLKVISEPKKVVRHGKKDRKIIAGFRFVVERQRTTWALCVCEKQQIWVKKMIKST